MAYSPASLTADFGAGKPEIGAPILYIVRHAQNDDDKNDKIRGLKDQPLNDVGRKQLGAVTRFFDDRPVRAIYTDDLSRTRETAMAVAQATGTGIETDTLLRSWDLGKLEGKSMDAHKLEIRDLKIHPDKIPVAGQSWGDFKRNCCEAIQRYVRMGMESSAPIVLVTHGSFIQVLFSEYGDWEDEGHYDHTPLDQTGIAALYLTRNGFELKILRGAKESPDE